MNPYQQELIDALCDYEYEYLNGSIRFRVGENKLIAIYDNEEDIICFFEDIKRLRVKMISLKQAVKIIKLHKLSNFS